MKNISRALLNALLAAACAAPLSSYTAEPVAPPSSVPASSFFDWAELDEPMMSPDGNAIAILVRNKAGRRVLAVIDTHDLQRFKIVAGMAEFDVLWAQWADSKSLVFSLGDESQSADQVRGQGLYGVDKDGGEIRMLINFRGQNSETGSMIKARHLDPSKYHFDQVLHDGSGDVVIDHLTQSYKFDTYGSEWTGTSPMRMNVLTGAVSDMGKAWPGHVFQWAIDADGHVRAGVQTDAGQTTIFTPEDAGAWKARTQFPSYEHGADGLTLIGVGADGQVYATKANGADGAQALYRFDAATGKADAQPIVSAHGFDIAPELVEDYRAHKVLGVHYQADAAGTVWFDPAMKALQAKVDARLPGFINRINPADCGCAARVLVTSHSDRQPDLFFLYDRTDDSLISIGAARASINRRQMADTDFVRIKARDGLEIPVYVTKPHGKGPWPTVVLVHGGPWVRGWNWEWDPESQFLASRGYLVVKPEYRGSEGYGGALLAAGDRQWGLKMQDDIADATVWAAQQGLEDPKRTCIAGASYGGYATLMGLVRYPDLYRCGVAWAAVTDLNLMYDIAWSDFGDDYKTYGMPQLVGDQLKDAEQLRATSPLQQAAKITRPLLLAHGGVDRRVPIDHATKMLSALQSAHAPVTWIEYKDEAHGWRDPETRVSWYEDMQKFLDANIGPGAGAANH